MIGRHKSSYARLNEVNVIHCHLHPSDEREMHCARFVLAFDSIFRS